MQLVKFSILILVASIFAGCGLQVDTFEGDTPPKIDTEIVIQLGGGFGGQGKSYRITPDGKLSSPMENEPEAIAQGSNLYQKVIERLAPLRKYSGTEHDLLDWGKIIACDTWTTDSGSVTIFWTSLQFEEMTGEDDLKNVSSFYRGCQSDKAQAVNERIDQAVGLMQTAIDQKKTSVKKAPKSENDHHAHNRNERPHARYISRGGGGVSGFRRSGGVADHIQNLAAGTLTRVAPLLAMTGFHPLP